MSDTFTAPNLPGLATTPVAPSPTGTPVVKPSYVPLLITILTVLCGGLVALQQTGASPTLKSVAGVVVMLLTSLLGVLSPGARKAS